MAINSIEAFAAPNERMGNGCINMYEPVSTGLFHSILRTQLSSQRHLFLSWGQKENLPSRARRTCTQHSKPGSKGVQKVRLHIHNHGYIFPIINETSTSQSSLFSFKSKYDILKDILKDIELRSSWRFVSHQRFIKSLRRSWLGALQVRLP